jgi:hypothetical protein
LLNTRSGRFAALLPISPNPEHNKNIFAELYTLSGMKTTE